MENSSKIKLRMLEVAKNKGISYEKFFNDFGSTYANFKGKSLKSSLRSHVLVDFYAKHPDTDLHWLLTGEHKTTDMHPINESGGEYEKKETITIQGKLDILVKQNEQLLKIVEDIYDKQDDKLKSINDTMHQLSMIEKLEKELEKAKKEIKVKCLEGR